VSASAARHAINAYGTLVNNARGCSASPGRWKCPPSQRGSPVANNPGSRPSDRVKPSSITEFASPSTVTACVSCHPGSRQQAQSMEPK